MIRLPDAIERMQGRNIRSATKSHLCKLIFSKGRQTKDFGRATLERSFSKAALSGWWQRKHHGKCRCSKLLNRVKRFTHSGIIRFSYQMSWNICLMSLSDDASTSADMSRFSQFKNIWHLDSIPTEKQYNLLNSSLIDSSGLVCIYIFFARGAYYCIRGINVSLSWECTTDLCKSLHKLEILCWHVLVRL